MQDARELAKEAFDHLANDRLAEAVARYREALDVDPRLSIAWNGLAMALARQEDLEGAIEAAKKLVELEPDEPLGHTSLSIFYQRLGRIAEAEDEKALATRLTMKQQR